MERVRCSRCCAVFHGWTYAEALAAVNEHQDRCPAAGFGAVTLEEIGVDAEAAW
jgi:hypothetical protein